LAKQEVLLIEWVPMASKAIGRVVGKVEENYTIASFQRVRSPRMAKGRRGKENVNPETSEHRRFADDFKEHLNPFGDRVGWRMAGNWLKFRELTFDASAPEGHLPSPSFATPCNGKEGEEQAPWGRWCVSFCFGGIKCGVLFLGWWSLLSRLEL
jgi:hypothetical protein